MKRLYILAWGSAALAGLVFWNSQPETTRRTGEGLVVERSWLEPGTTKVTPQEYCRAPDQTFLTYPEWFLVFGPAEYADHLQHRTSSSFPFMTHVFQAWESYRVVDDQTRGVFPPNDEYHTMINVINTSSTVEFGLKHMYEAVIGRLTDIGDGEVATDEDRFNARYAREYVVFLDTAPWYEFDFVGQMGSLWRDQCLIGSHPLRKLERRYFLTTELTVKAAYGWLIKQAAGSAYEKPSPVTAVVLDAQPAERTRLMLKDMNVLTTHPDGSALVTLPRYAPFTPLAVELAKSGARFEEIAGNRTAVLITAVGASSWVPKSSAFEVLFSQPIPTRPGQSRWALVTPVAQLHEVLRDVPGEGLAIEHVFDF